MKWVQGRPRVWLGALLLVGFAGRPALAQGEGVLAAAGGATIGLELVDALAGSERRDPEPGADASLAVTELIEPPRAPAAADAREIWEKARTAGGRHLRVSLEERRLWLMEGDSALFSAPVAIGKSVVLEYDDRVWTFTTPRGERRILGKERDPVWIPPDWHYVELAAMMRWRLQPLEAGSNIPLSDGSRMIVRGDRIGRLTPSGEFVPVPRGEEAIFDGTLFMPPLGSANRRVPGILGRFKLDLGDAYYLHGTPNEQSIGGAVTHGCIRLFDSDLAHLYREVPIGTRVFIY